MSWRSTSEAWQNGGLPQDTLDLDTSSLEHDPSVIFAVDASLRIVYCNAAWDRFALENGGASVVRARQTGKDLARVIPGPLQSFYADGFEQARNSGEVWTHEYECSSPEVFRKFQMRVAPLRITENDVLLIVVNSLVLEAPHTRIGFQALEEVYRDGQQTVTMCCHCRRTRRGSGEAWDWVPQFVRAMPEAVSHGLCATCVSLHYGSAHLQRA